jgi:hypothetical protein
MTATTVTAAGQSRAEEGQGAVGPAICAAHVPAVEMACGMDRDVVGRGGGNKAWEPEDILGAITGSRGSSGTITIAQGGQQWQSPKLPPLPLTVLQASLARKGLWKDVVVLIAVGSSRGVKTNNNYSSLFSSCATVIFFTGKPITSFVTICIFSFT